MWWTLQQNVKKAKYVSKSVKQFAITIGRFDSEPCFFLEIRLYVERVLWTKMSFWTNLNEPTKVQKLELYIECNGIRSLHWILCGCEYPCKAQNGVLELEISWKVGIWQQDSTFRLMIPARVCVHCDALVATVSFSDSRKKNKLIEEWKQSCSWIIIDQSVSAQELETEK